MKFKGTQSAVTHVVVDMSPVEAFKQIREELLLRIGLNRDVYLTVDGEPRDMYSDRGASELKVSEFQMGALKALDTVQVLLVATEPK